MPFCVIFLCALHGFSALKIGLILIINFLISKRLPHKLIPVATWAFNIIILFANEYCQGYSFLRISELLLPWTTARFGITQKAGVIESFARWLDSYGGLVPRWEIHFNITVLRLISFNLDYYWSSTATEANLFEVRQNLNFEASFRSLTSLHIRRNSSILLLYPSGIGSLFRHGPKTFLSATISHMLSTRLYTLRARY